MTRPVSGGDRRRDGTGDRRRDGTGGQQGRSDPPIPAEPTLRDLAPEGQLRRLELTVTRRLDGLLHGQYLGLLPGSGSEIAGSREYRPGEDEVRRMDWAVTARTTSPHVREVDADRELSTWLLIDSTPSMDFGTAELEKRELAVAAVAAVGFLTAGAGNRLGAHVIGADGVRRYPARTGRSHLLGLLRTLLAAPRGAAAGQAGGAPRGPASGSASGLADGAKGGAAGEPVGGRAPGLADAIGGLHRATPRRGLAVIVSDFLDGLPEDDSGGPAWEAAVRRLAARHQVLAIEITDPRELELPDVGVITLVDPETGWRREVSTGDRRTRERYAAAAAGQRELVRQALRRAGANHLALRTDRDWTADIVRHVHAQRRLTAAGRTNASRPAAGRTGAATVPGGVR